MRVHESINYVSIGSAILQGSQSSDQRSDRARSVKLGRFIYNSQRSSLIISTVAAVLVMRGSRIAAALASNVRYTDCGP